MTSVDRLLVALALLTVPLAGCIGGSGAGEVSVEAEGPGTWVLPGPRSLDPAVFGTPGQPARVHEVPVDQRGLTADGCQFTHTRGPTPFSNRTANVSGSLELEAVDESPRDDPDSGDEARLEAEWTSPDGNHTYRLASERVIPQGPGHPFLGGVGTDVVIHGTTGIGTPLMPEAFAYVTMWGVASFERDGEQVAENRLVHVMVTEGIRDGDGGLGFAPARPDEVEVHLMVPPQRVGEQGPEPLPLPTAFQTPGGPQPFAHLVFDDVEVDGDPFLDADERPPGEAVRRGHGAGGFTEADCRDVRVGLNGTVTGEGYEVNATAPVGVAGADLEAGIRLADASSPARLTLTLENPSGEEIDSATVTAAEPEAQLRVADVNEAGDYGLRVTGQAVDAAYEADAVVDYEGPPARSSG